MKWNEYEWYGDDSDAKNNFKLWKKNCPQHKRIGHFFEDFFIPKKNDDDQEKNNNNIYSCAS